MLDDELRLLAAVEDLEELRLEDIFVKKFVAWAIDFSMQCKIQHFRTKVEGFRDILDHKVIYHALYRQAEPP